MFPIFTDPVQTNIDIVGILGSKKTICAYSKLPIFLTYSNIVPHMILRVFIACPPSSVLLAFQNIPPENKSQFITVYRKGNVLTWII
jgi:hypothetical protein